MRALLLLDTPESLRALFHRMCERKTEPFSEDVKRSLVEFLHALAGSPNPRKITEVTKSEALAAFPGAFLEWMDGSGRVEDWATPDWTSRGSEIRPEHCAEELLAEIAIAVDQLMATLLRDRLQPDTFIADERALFLQLQRLRRLDSALRPEWRRLTANAPPPFGAGVRKLMRMNPASRVTHLLAQKLDGFAKAGS